MLKLYPAQLIAGTNVTAYQDDSDPTLFYVMPEQASIRTDPTTNKPSFKFIKYLMPVDRPDGNRGGGFLIFDSVFVLTDATRKKIQTVLDQQVNAANRGTGKGSTTAKIALPSFAKGTAALTLLDSGGALVSKIESAGKPSLLGSLVCSFTAELTPEGAAVVEGAMKGSGGIIQIAYDLSYWAVLPPLTGKIWFNATKFASFYQNIQKSHSHSFLGLFSWGPPNAETETLRETFTSSDAGGVQFDFSQGMDPSDPNTAKVKNDLTNWGWQQLNVAVQNVLGASSQSAPSTTAAAGTGDASTNGPGSGTSGTAAPTPGQNTGADLGADRSDDGEDHVIRNESSLAKFSFFESYNEKDSILYETVQQGTLSNVPNFAQYAVTINANDPFFAQIHASIGVNADFAKFSIQSVDVNVTYDKASPPTVGGFHFTKPDDLFKFDSNTVNGDMNYKYTMNVNYKDQSAPYQAPVLTTNAPVVTLDVGSLGVFFVDVTITNVDFTKTPSVLVAIKYPDTDATGAPISKQLAFDATKKADSVVVVTMKTTDKPYQYQVSYAMADGSQLITPWQTGLSTDLRIPSPFTQKTVSFLAEGDFTNDVDNIFLKMTYVDTANNYQQSSDYTFTSTNRSHDWSFPIVSTGTGTIHYSGVVSHKDRTTDNIADTTATADLITFGPPNQAIVTVTPDPALLDFTQVKLVQVNFSYTDPANKIALQQEVVLKSTGATPASWTFYVKDPTKTAYSYQATYYMAGSPGQIKLPPATSSDTDLVLTMPTS